MIEWTKKIKPLPNLLNNQKLFCSVNHKILLKDKGIPDFPSKLFKSYLSNRTQTVKINNNTKIINA